MNAAAAAVLEQRAWSQPGSSNNDNTDQMAHISGDLDELSNIFNIADFDLESIHNVNPAQYGDSIHSSHAETHPTTPYLETIPQQSQQGQQPPPHGTAAHDFVEHEGFGMGTDVTAQQYEGHDERAAMNFNGNALYHQQLPQHFAHMQQSPYTMGLQQQQYTAGGQIPPTPNSYEMHGEAGRFLQQHSQQHSQQAIYEQQKQMRKFEQQQRLQNAQFTPMASPDGTPHQYALQSEFTTPGAYFSPLTSPALHAQLPPAAGRPLIQQASQGYFTTNPSTAPSSNAPSPVDLSNDIDMFDSGMAGMAESTKRGGRRKVVTPRSVGQIHARPRQSPIQKPQKRKSGLLSSIVPAKDFDKMLQQDAQHIQPAGVVSHVQAFDSSESGSISPEPLSEALMGPPPRPPTSSHTHSPSLNGQSQHNVLYGSKKAAAAAAATPKSILSMRSQHVDNSKGSPLNIATSTLGHVSSLDDLELPEAAAARQRPALSKIDIAAAERSNPRKTPKLGPSSTPSSLRPDSSSASPITAAFSPVSASTPAGLLKDKKVDSKSRTSKKRSSVGATNSALASPALRPRISPSIKPLLPEGCLTSKRTSHKVAEQGRRNRINEALKEMQSLIPSPGLLAKTSSDEYNGSKKDDDDDGSPDANGELDGGKDAKESAAAKSNSSKAATVESANRYIRLLKESEASQRAAILALQKENEQIRRRLAQATGSVLDDTEMACIEEVDAYTPDGCSDRAD